MVPCYIASRQTCYDPKTNPKNPKTVNQTAVQTVLAFCKLFPYQVVVALEMSTKRTLNIDLYVCVKTVALSLKLGSLHLNS